MMCRSLKILWANVTFKFDPYAQNWGHLNARGEHLF